MDTFTEKSEKPRGGWELQPQTPMGLNKKDLRRKLVMF